MPAEPAAVEARGLVRCFGTRQAVNGLHLRAERGQVLALLGPNGAGKTTTIELCQGFQVPDAGTVQVLGLDPRSGGATLRPRIGVMPQGGGAYPGVRAREMLDLIATCAARPLPTGWLLDVLGLTSVEGVPFKRLSGGQQQRLALACALVGRPELVFLDEPTSGLDPQARNLVWELVTALRGDGVTVLLTTHQMEEAEALADQVVIMDRGRLVATGSPAQLTADGTDGQLRFGAAPGLDLDALAAVLPAGTRPSEPQPGSYVVTGEIDPQVLATVTSWCAQQGALADELRVGRPSLEDVFLDLTGRELRA